MSKKKGHGQQKQQSRFQLAGSKAVKAVQQQQLQQQLAEKENSSRRAARLKQQREGSPTQLQHEASSGSPGAAGAPPTANNSSNQTANNNAPPPAAAPPPPPGPPLAIAMNFKTLSGGQSPQNLNYHQQQQLHQQQLQRIGGLQRLTADLAGLQFNDPDALLHNLPQLSRARQIQSKHLRHIGAPQAAQLPAAALGPSKAGAGGGAATGQQQQQPQQQQELQLADQLDMSQLQSAIGSSVQPDTEQQQAEAAEKARDAQDTADDSGLLKRYKINHLIGLGNYARVYRGSLVQNSKEVAIKAINLSKTTDNYKQKFLPRELSILRRISHVNICKIYEIIQVADRIFIVMQYCHRGTIADLLQRNSGPLNEPLSRFLFGPTIDAIVYLHGIDIAHRDIKIENILLDSDFVPKLTDFSYGCFLTKQSAKSPKQGGAGGAGGSHGSKALNETFCGTLPYLSPEMIRQLPYDSKKTDSWSLGVCLYVMLNDRLPFPFNDIKSMVRKQLTRDYKFRANVEVSEPCRDLLSQMFEPEFIRRPSSREIARHSWLQGPTERPSS